MKIKKAYFRCVFQEAGYFVNVIRYFWRTCFLDFSRNQPVFTKENVRIKQLLKEKGYQNSLLAKNDQQLRFKHKPERS